MPVLLFYYRNGCHLCEDMWQQLQELRRERRFEIESLDIALDSCLLERYGSLIPVLAAEKQVICHYYLDPIALNRYLDSLPAGDKECFSTV